MINRLVLFNVLFCLSVLFLGAAVVLLAFDRPWQLVQQNWIITPLAVVAAGVANTTAVGGGFLFVHYLAFTAPGVIIGGRYGARFGRWIEARVRQRSRLRTARPSMNHSP